METYDSFAIPITRKIHSVTGISMEGITSQCPTVTYMHFLHSPRLVTLFIWHPSHVPSFIQ